ncbi:MAG: acyltransferase [Calditrichales bacterium]|nr:MAG: acyltransferase [Calditrichales bacterium]
MRRVGFFQFHPRFGQIGYNLKTVVKALKNVSADLIVLPELPFSGYYFQNREEVAALSEEIGHSSTVDTLTSLCRDRDFYLVTGFAERAADKFFNSAILIGPDGVMHTYRKLHLFSEEKRWFEPGDVPLQIHEIRGANLGMMVCFDWIFPEVTRTLALLGADIIAHPSNLVLSYCQEAMITRCLENSIYAITANRFGPDTRPQGELVFTGKSQIAAPRGALLYRAPAKRNMLYIHEIEIQQARNKFMTKYNDILADRRPAYYLSK